MGEHEKESKQSPVYEAILPAWRFKELAQVAIVELAEQVERGNNIVEAAWPKEQKGDHYKVQWRQDHDPWFGGSLSTYTLDHYVNRLPGGQPNTRYRVTESQSGLISNIKVFDERNQEKQLDQAGKLAAARDALSILSGVTPDKAKLILDWASDHQYALLIGSYVLSDLAIEGAKNDLNIEAVWQAVQTHENTVAQIEKEELKRAKRKRAKKYPQPFYAETVQEAVETRRMPNKADRYAAVDVLGATDSVAEHMGRKWHHLLPVENEQEPGDAAGTEVSPSETTSEHINVPVDVIDHPALDIPVVVEPDTSEPDEDA